MMQDWYIAVSQKCQAIGEKAISAILAHEENQAAAVDVIKGYMKADYAELEKIWRQVDPTEEKADRFGDMQRHIRFGYKNDLFDILKHDIPALLKAAEKIALTDVAEKVKAPLGFENLLHPAIVTNALGQYRNGYLREAVLNSVMAVFDMIRKKSKLSYDGKDLTGQAFGTEKGKLIFSEVATESGKNDQKGFMQIYEGVYTGVRNVKAHTLEHDLDDQKAAQYLVMLSLLARRVDECKLRDETE